MASPVTRSKYNRKQAQRRAAMDRRMHCIIPNELYNINHNITIRHCSFEYALHIHDVIYEGHFNSFDDINFFHTFSKISQYLRIIMLNKIQRFIQNFMPYKMIYRLTRKFVFLYFHFSRFYEHFRHLREKYTLK